MQAFRGLAAITVLLHHLSEYFLSVCNYSFLGGSFLPGWAGVDFFFCLSGFIIYYTNAHKIDHKDQLKTYIKSRFFRIYPLVWILTFFYLGGVYFFPVISTGRENNVASIVLSLLLIPQYDFPIIAPAWTLCFEVLFYLIFGLGLLLPPKKFFRLLFIWAMLILLGDFFPKNYFSLYFLFKNNLEFLLGCGAAYLYKHNLLSGKDVYLLALGITGVLMAWIFNYSGSMLRGSWPSVILFGLSFTLLILGAAQYESRKKMSIYSPLVAIGEGSYSIYLLHFPYIPLANINLAQNFQLINSCIFIGVVLLFIAGGYLLHISVEKPIYNRVKRREPV